MNPAHFSFLAIGLALASRSVLSEAETVVTSDVCVYGGTSGGAVAAVAAARLGKSVVLATGSSHVGGMTVSGLGATDTGERRSIGGIAAEFYERVGHAYGSADPAYAFEPHVAEQVFRELLDGAGVTVHTNRLLAAVTMSNLCIAEVAMIDGTVYRAKEFVDATYEGDLMAMAGVSFTWGRESKQIYRESLAGVQAPRTDYRIDPYVVPGNSASGLLPLIQYGSPGRLGQGDYRMQCYNFRLCLTRIATNQIPIVPPPHYSEATYELVRRYIKAHVAAEGSIKLNNILYIPFMLPNGKADVNSGWGVSTDYIGCNYTYTTNSYAGRQAIYRRHQDYTAGLLYYLATSTNVPQNVRTAMQSWGYAKDEFQDNGGWPYELYVREARRMIGDYVMQQLDAEGRRTAKDSIALASYALDCHAVARLAVDDTTVTEGQLGGAVPQPYPVSYRSIVPKVGQCQNLFCTFALSASHVCFASLRMEPVFMMTSQSAGAAAAFAIDDNVPVQRVNYPKLAAQLLSDGQILTWDSHESSKSTPQVLTVASGAGITASGDWVVGGNPGGWPPPGGTYWHDNNAAKGTQYVRFNPAITTNGYYDIYLWWVQGGNRSTNTPVEVIGAHTTNRCLLDQTIHGSVWVRVAASNYFDRGTSGSITIRNDGTTGYVVVNAVRWQDSRSHPPFAHVNAEPIGNSSKP